LDIIQKFWLSLRKLFVHPGVPSWLRAWSPAISHSSADCTLRRDQARSEM